MNNDDLLQILIELDEEGGEIIISSNISPEKAHYIIEGLPKNALVDYAASYVGKVYDKYIKDKEEQE